jgi:hypothetical protein
MLLHGEYARRDGAGWCGGTTEERDEIEEGEAAASERHSRRITEVRGAAARTPGGRHQAGAGGDAAEAALVVAGSGHPAGRTDPRALRLCRSR